jgi:DNA-binding transcriptional MerR regulator
MDSAKGLVSITEYARLRGVTSETLRHYDRIGLLKPVETDAVSGMRYYSLALDQEKLGTILELKQLGMSLDEIRAFLRDRTFDKSLATLKAKYIELERKLRSLDKLKTGLGEMIESMEQLREKEIDIRAVRFRRIKTREVLFSEEVTTDEFEVNRATILLETRLRKLAPIMGYVRYVLVFPENSWNLLEHRCKVGILVEPGEINTPEISRIIGGRFACKYGYGHPLSISEELSHILEHCERKGYELAGDAIEVVTVDMSLTDVPEENVYELQVPVRKSVRSTG